MKGPTSQTAEIGKLSLSTYNLSIVSSWIDIADILGYDIGSGTASYTRFDCEAAMLLTKSKLGFQPRYFIASI